MHIMKLWTQVNRVRGSDDTERAGRSRKIFVVRKVSWSSFMSNPHPRSIDRRLYYMQLHIDIHTYLLVAAAISN
jgi:hypothetical protein